MSRIVAIVGRPNVGKSTLFNRLTGEFKAIVDDYSGVTRDLHYGFSDWNGIDFTVIDTGGFVPESSDTFEAAIRDQVHIAIEEAGFSGPRKPEHSREVIGRSELLAKKR